MLHRWDFADGTVVRWTDSGSVLVDGDTKLAWWVQWGVNAPSYRRPSIRVVAPPGGLVDVDFTNIWLVDMYLRLEALRLHVDVVSSTYTQRDEDMTPEVAAEVLRARAAYEEDPEGSGKVH